MNHPKTNEEGLWIDLCTENLKIKGLSRTNYLLISLGSLNKEDAEIKIQNKLQELITNVVSIEFKLRSFIPLIPEKLEISEGTSKSYIV